MFQRGGKSLPLEMRRILGIEGVRQFAVAIDFSQHELGHLIGSLQVFEWRSGEGWFVKFDIQLVRKPGRMIKQQASHSVEEDPG